MENPFSAVAIAATVEVIVDTKEQVSYQTTKMQREIILTKLKEKGCRITKQRLRLIDIILQYECSSCKEIFYRALEEPLTLTTQTRSWVASTIMTWYCKARSTGSSREW